MFKVQEQSCSTCIYRADSPLDIKKLEAQACKKDGYRICHHSNDVCCRGFWNKHKDDFNLGRIAQRLKMIKFVRVDTLEAQ